ncbi:MAG: hypothetical protein GY811_13680 [Myxococcales bacterium]|nr:hypothetical protein [Myxococcales bacterium]
MSRFLLLAPLLLVFAACHTPPDEACNRVRFGWPFLELDPNSDVSAEEGIQIDFDVRSDFSSGVEANLFLRLGDSEEQALVGEATSGSDGLLSFQDVSVPEGEVVFIVEARDDCGLHRTGKRVFVWDGLGFPACDLGLATEPTRPADGSIPVLSSEHDENSGEDGMQVRIVVETGRPDMEVTLFARDREQGESREFSVPSGASGLSEIPLTLPAGEQAIRAVCYWAPEELRVNTATYLYDVATP